MKTMGTDLRVMDDLARRAGEVTRRVAHPKRLAWLLSVKAGAVSDRMARYICEGLKSGPLQRMFAFLSRAAVDPQAQPDQMITAQRELLEECRAERFSVVELEAQLVEGLEREIDAQAEEDKASGRLSRALAMGTQMERRAAIAVFVQAQAEETALQERNAGVARVLVRRIAH